MPRRLALMTALATAHLLLVVCGALHYRPLRADNALGRAVATYGALSGADTSYGFFAPRVAPQLKAEFRLTDANGRTWTEVPEIGATHEANLRLESSISMVNFDEFREGVAASWAAAMFGRNPDARSVELRVAYQDLPPLELHRQGCPIDWQPLYEVKFDRR